MPRNKSNNTVPEKWDQYEPFNTPVEGTRFIAFKVPLKMDICRSLPEEQRFTPDRLMADTAYKDYHLGLVIDLTNTKRYYNPSEIEHHGVRHIKISSEGHALPSRAVQAQFMREVDHFLEQNASNALLIGVHCAHGLNRSGYLICKYMIDRMHVRPKDAIEAFNTARGYDMERESYIADLMQGSSAGAMAADDDWDEDLQARYDYYDW